MAFRSFRYHPQAEQGLNEIMDRGDEDFARLKEEIRRVRDSWIPDDDEEPILIVPYDDFYLTFTVAKEDPTMLILASIDRQPEF